jgi:hypothetical protein
VKFREAFFGGGERRFFLAESETNLVRAVARIVVKTGTRNARDADFFD